MQKTNVGKKIHTVVITPNQTFCVIVDPVRRTGGGGEGYISRTRRMHTVIGANIMIVLLLGFPNAMLIGTMMKRKVEYRLSIDPPVA